MEEAFDVNELEGMRRAELQKLCKSVGIKANMKVCSLNFIRLLRALVEVCDSCTQSMQRPASCCITHGLR